MLRLPKLAGEWLKVSSAKLPAEEYAESKLTAGFGMAGML